MHFTQGLHRALQQHPDRIAVRTRTFRELGDRAARLAAALQAFGMKTGDRVAMLALNADRYLDDHLAVPWGGGMLNPCNVRWNVAEIVYSLNDSSSTLLIVDDAFTGMVEAVRRDVPTLAHVIYADERDAPAGLHDLESLIARATPVEDLRRTGDDLLGIFHTGGTTDFPKGVMISRQNLYASGTALLAEGTAPRGGVYLHAAPMFHLADFGISIPQHIAGTTHAIIQSFSPKAKIRSGGRANFGTEVRIVDAEDVEVPHGVVGEIAIRGPNVMLDYWNKPDLTAEALRGGWMHTGDGPYMDKDGFMFIVDRMKDMIITGGENVYSAEVENALSQHAAVAMCAVLGIPSQDWGATVHAVVVCKAGANATPEEIIAHGRTLIAGYKCSRSVEFRDALRLSGAGKNLKTTLRKPFWDGQERQIA